MLLIIWCICSESNALEDTQQRHIVCSRVQNEDTINGSAGVSNDARGLTASVARVHPRIRQMRLPSKISHMHSATKSLPGQLRIEIYHLTLIACRRLTHSSTAQWPIQIDG